MVSNPAKGAKTQALKGIDNALIVLIPVLAIDILKILVANNQAHGVGGKSGQGAAHFHRRMDSGPCLTQKTGGMP